LTILICIILLWVGRQFLLKYLTNIENPMDTPNEQKQLKHEQDKEDQVFTHDLPTAHVSCFEYFQK